MLVLRTGRIKCIVLCFIRPPVAKASVVFALKQQRYHMSWVHLPWLFHTQFMLMIQGHLGISLQKSLDVGSVILMSWTKQFSFEPWKLFHFRWVLPCIFKLAWILDMNTMFHGLGKELVLFCIRVYSPDWQQEFIIRYVHSFDISRSQETGVQS